MNIYDETFLEGYYDALDEMEEMSYDEYDEEDLDGAYMEGYLAALDEASCAGRSFKSARGPEAKNRANFDKIRFGIIEKPSKKVRPNKLNAKIVGKANARSAGTHDPWKRLSYESRNF